MSRNALCFTVAILLPLFFTNAYGKLTDAPTVFRTGDWRVVRDVNKMTDKVECTGLLGAGYDNQLTEAEFFVGFKGGVKSLTLRFGEKPAKPLRLASELEKYTQSAIISGGDFNELLEVERLRVQALTILDSVLLKDLNVRGIREVINNIKSGCPLLPESSKASVVVTVPQKNTEDSTCTKQIMDRMRSANIKESQISLVCK